MSTPENPNGNMNVEYNDNEYNLICGDIKENWVAITTENVPTSPRANDFDNLRIVKPADLKTDTTNIAEIYDAIQSRSQHVMLWNDHLPLNINTKYNNVTVTTVNGEQIYASNPKQDLDFSTLPSEPEDVLELVHAQTKELSESLMNAYERPHLFLFKHPPETII